MASKLANTADQILLKATLVAEHKIPDGWTLVEDKSKISDGYHTFEELYEHRAALFCVLANAWPHWSWRSRKHADGSIYEGFFIAGINLDLAPTACIRPTPITYHLEDKYWDYLEEISTFEFAPTWDGHTPKDVVERLLNSIHRFD